jgi:predicted secreted protein
VDRLYQILFSRNADKVEKTALLDFLNKQEKIIQSKAADGKFVISTPVGLKADKPQDPIKLAAFVDLVHTVANSNEFAYRF